MVGLLAETTTLRIGFTTNAMVFTPPGREKGPKVDWRDTRQGLELVRFSLYSLVIRSKDAYYVPPTEVDPHPDLPLSYPTAPCIHYFGDALVPFVDNLIQVNCMEGSSMIPRPAIRQVAQEPPEPPEPPGGIFAVRKPVAPPPKSDVSGLLVAISSHLPSCATCLLNFAKGQF
ncbi:hypothetical protein K438DRAFT_1756122 [Mycena galopus ATCC 62051]|nr:hypothetical protein K438DRAFT_1756122 [Mycena galopus ATCC 62051]